MPRESAQLSLTSNHRPHREHLILVVHSFSLMDEQDYFRSSEMARSNTPNTSAIADSPHCPFNI